MCTYRTEQLATVGSGKGAKGWFQLTQALVYFDHPYHAQAEHTLNIDFLNPAQGPAARVAVELDPGSALALADAIRELVGEAAAQLGAGTQEGGGQTAAAG